MFIIRLPWAECAGPLLGGWLSMAAPQAPRLDKIYFFTFLAPTGAQEVALFVCPCVTFINSSLNLHSIFM